MSDKLITFEELAAANATIKTKKIKGKDYAEVPQRVQAFRRVYPMGSIQTELLEDDGERCTFRAIVTDETGLMLGTGTAYEVAGASYINKTSYIENCETSAVGRALGFAGFGIDTSIASAEEVENAINQQDKESKRSGKKWQTPKGDTPPETPFDIMQGLMSDATPEMTEVFNNGLAYYKAQRFTDLTDEQANYLIKRLKETKGAQDG